MIFLKLKAISKSGKSKKEKIRVWEDEDTDEEFQKSILSFKNDFNIKLGKNLAKLKKK